MNILYLMRHGETDANRNFIVQGRMDNPLNQTGMDQAKKTGDYLKANQEHFDLIVSSPLKRAYDTARIICKVLGDQKTVLTQFALTERNFGDFDGKKIDAEYAQKVVNDEIPNMEHNAELEERVFGALKDLCLHYPNKKLLIVAHSHVIKAVLVHLIPNFTYTSYLANCSINQLSYDGVSFKAIAHNINPLE